MVLERIVARKRVEVAARMSERPLSRLRSSALERSDRSLEEALRAPEQSYILECKKASPSRGPIAPGRDALDIVSSYAPYASAISVLCDAVDFGGSLDDLERVRAALPQPVLCKDFVIDPYQVYEARSRGADAILLMLSVLDDASFRACFAACEALGMDALVEVHDAEEMRRAVALEARIIGINNRDLKTLKVDLRTTEALSSLAPPDRILVSESGLSSHADALSLRAHADAFLVGTALLISGDPSHAVRELLFGRVKLCGLTRPEDAAMAWRLGASYGGLIFAPSSKRAIDLRRGAAIRSAAPLRYVGVFVDASNDQIVRHARELELSAVQLHGAEPRAAIAALRQALPDGCEVWKAAAMAERALDPEEALGADRLLADSSRDGRSGGTGARFDWRLLGDSSARRQVWLAGGLAPDNIAEADRLGMYGLDVNSGVERAPGIKDNAACAKLFRALRG